MLRSKQQQNQPNQEASTTSEWRVAAHIAAREHVRRAARPGERPGPRPSPATALAGWGEQEGKGPRFLPSLPFRPPTPRARGAQRRNGPQACTGESSQRDLTLLPTVPVEGTAGPGWARGAAAHSRGLWLQPVPVTLTSGCLGPSSPTLPCRQCPHPSEGVCGPPEPVRPAALGPDPNTKEGLTWFQNCGAPRPPSPVRGLPGSLDRIIPLT